MKIVNTILASICLLSLTACGTLQNWNSDYLSGDRTEYLSNDQGTVGDCHGFRLSTSDKPSAADRFWQDNDLPKGTTDYMCKDGKAYLLNKVTDCQSKVITNQQGGIMKFRRDNGFPDGYSYVAFTCTNGSEKPIMWE